MRDGSRGGGGEIGVRIRGEGFGGGIGGGIGGGGASDGGRENGS